VKGGIGVGRRDFWVTFI